MCIINTCFDKNKKELKTWSAWQAKTFLVLNTKLKNVNCGNLVISNLVVRTRKHESFRHDKKP